ncbi:hypothetical protein [Cetobacterium sp.]
MIQNEVVSSDEGMSIEIYFGVVCNETLSNWNKILKNKDIN